MRGPAADNSKRRWVEPAPADAPGAPALATVKLAAMVLGLWAMTPLAIPPTHAGGAEIQRLPPVRLPLVSADRLAHEASQAEVEMDDIVQLAGGAVELRVRRGWWIWEVPVGREVRVALTPTRPASLKEPPVMGYWVCFHLGSANSAESPSELAERMQQRLIEVAGGNAEPLRAVRFQRLGRWDAAELEFMLPTAEGTNRTPIHGSHVLVSTPWGLFEFHAQFPANVYDQQLGETARLLSTVQLSAPAIAAAGPSTPETDAAAAVHGSWKAFRSRLRLSSGGEIEIEPDRAQLISPPADGPRPELLRGSYRADGDLLFVQWRDGSKLNFRWKLAGDALLLTDHEGQTSQLRRIAE